MARLFTTGFETGTTEWNGATLLVGPASLTVTASYKRTGNYSASFASVTSTSSALFRQVFGDSQTELFGRLALRINSEASQNDWLLLSFRDVDNAVQFSLRYGAGTATLSWYDATGTRQALGNVLIPTDTWVVLEFQVVISATGSATLKVNGTTDAVWSGDTDYTNAGNVRSMYFGMQYIAGSTAFGNIWLDDIAINNTEGSYENSWVGLGGTFWQKPDADGYQNDWTPSTGTDNYATVDETPPNTTDYVQALNAAELDLYEVQDCPAYIARVRLVQVMYRAALVTSGENYLRDVIRVDTTNYEGDTFTIVPLIPSFTLYKGLTHYINPDTVAAWQVSEVDDLQAGFEIVEPPA